MQRRSIIALIVGIVLVSTGSYFLLRSAFHRLTIEPATGTPGITRGTIRIGSVKPLTGPASFLGTEYAIGERTYLNAVNDAGGIFGRTIEVIDYDDQYDPKNTIYDTQKLIVHDDIFALLDYVGTATGKKIIPMIDEARIPLIGLFSGAKIFREPIQPYIFNIRASYREEAAKLIDYLVKARGITKIAVLYQYDEFGFDVLQGIKDSLKTYGMTSTVDASYERNTLDVEPALDTINAARPEAVILASVYGPGAQFVKLAHAKGFDPIFATMSFIGPEKFQQDLGAESEGILVSQIMPIPGTEPDPNCPDGYEQLLAKYFPGKSPSLGTLEGFMNAKIMVEGLRRAGSALTRASFINALESLTDYPVGEHIRASFSKTDHQALHDVYLTRIADGKFILADTETTPTHDCIQL